MILNFPYLHKDELVYSGIGRYFDYLKENNFKWVTEHLFGLRSYRATVGLPSGLNNLYTNLPRETSYTPSYLLENHTQYPFFRPFIEESRHEKTINDIVFGNGKGVMTRLGMIASTIPNKRKLYYCASCVLEQMDEIRTDFLDVFWNRIHQISGVLVCHKHKEWLKKTSFSLGVLNQHSYVSLGSLIDSLDIDLTVNPLQDNKVNKLHIKLSENVEWIINNYLPPRRLNYYRERYIEYLKPMGLARPSGSVNVIRLKELFLDFYPLEFLTQIQSEFNINDEQTWVQMIIQKNRKAFHPIRHILMIILLAGSASTFFNNNYKFMPFGSGPWKCNNPVCSKKITSISIGYSRDVKKVYGDFQCICGFLERKYEDGKRKVLVFGKEWENELVKQLKNGKRIYYLSDLLEADIVTIKKIAEENNLLDKWKTLKKYSPSKKVKKGDLKVKHRKIWLSVVKENPNFNKSQIRKVIPGTYIWLYRNDKQFLKENSPAPSQLKRCTNRVDWQARDMELLKTVKEIVSNWEEGIKPKRITKTAIGKRTERLYWLQKCEDKFPETLSYINSCVESIEDFQIRRVKWVFANELKESQVRETEVYIRAALRFSISPEVKEFISKQTVLHNKKVSKIKPLLDDGN
ncbi:TnsD family Tn7-like transposition protein [Oceanobacillus picturae]|uniref:TnsD family Tn7-like transposition protein n=1 Tax=Oceanobacillus picturae TaxID=171693 RepID=UPI00364112E8